MHVFEPQRLKGAGKLGRDAPRSWGGGEAGTESQGGRSLVEPGGTPLCPPCLSDKCRRFPHSAHGERAAPERGIPQATVPALPPSLPPSLWSDPEFKSFCPVILVREPPCVCGSLEVTAWPPGCPPGSEEKPAPSSDGSPDGVAHTSRLGVRKTVPLDRAEEGATTETFSGCALHVPLGSPELLKCGWCD